MVRNRNAGCCLAEWKVVMRRLCFGINPGTVAEGENEKI
jgi:hypothetical protein